MPLLKSKIKQEGTTTHDKTDLFNARAKLTLKRHNIANSNAIGDLWCSYESAATEI